MMTVTQQKSWNSHHTGMTWSAPLLLPASKATILNLQQTNAIIVLVPAAFLHNPQHIEYLLLTGNPADCCLSRHAGCRS